GARDLSNFWNFGIGELSYEVDSLTTLSFYGNISGGHSHNVSNQVITFSYPSAPDTVVHYDLDSRNEFPTNSVGADYIKKFSNNKEKEFSIRFNGEFSKSNIFLTSVMDFPVD